MTAILLALGSSIGYGVTDFLGGLAARRMPVLLLGAITQPLGLIALLLVVPFTDGVMSEQTLIWGVVAGVGGSAGYVLLFRSLAIGPMSVASPLSALVAVVLPVTAGLVFGERLSPGAWAGIALGVIAVIMVSQVHEDAPHPVSTHVLVLSGAAGVCISVFLVALERSPDNSGLWVLVVERTVASVLLVVLAVGTRSLVRPTQTGLVLAGTSTLLDLVATFMFVLATREGLLSVVAVITALYPAATVLMARGILGEQLQTLQRLGLLLAAVSVSLLAVSG